jgi:hypothetical protein
LQRSAEDAQNDFQAEMQELYNGLASKVYDVLANYAQQQGYTLVFDVTTAAEGSRALRQRVHQHHQADHRRLQREVGCARSSGPAGSGGASAGPAGRQASRPAIALKTKDNGRLQEPRIAGLLPLRLTF